MRSVLAILAAMLLSGCATGNIGDVRQVGEAGLSIGIRLECGKTLEARKARLEAFNLMLRASDTRAQAMALDCDGDGEPDF